MAGHGDHRLLQVGRFSEVAVDLQRDLMIGDHTGLVRRPSGWLKVELVETEEAPDFMRGRRPPCEHPVPSDFVPEPADSRKVDAPSDARTLYVDTDEQGVGSKNGGGPCLNLTFFFLRLFSQRGAGHCSPFAETCG